jgi:streptogramin lyase
VPPAPPRPQGLERNLVLTSWDWGGPSTFAHDEITTDKRNPTVNANGPLYGVDYGNDKLLVVDPVKHAASSIEVPVNDPAAPTAVPQTMAVPSAYWGDEVYWTNRSHPHNPMIDAQGRVWTTQGTRPPEKQPAYCTDPANPFARSYPLARSGSGVSIFDPKTGRITLIDTCFGTHHLQFAEDRDNTLYFSGDTNVIGWLNTRVWEQTRDVQKASGWCAVVVDTNGDGRIGAYTNPTEPLDPARDRRISGFPYGIIPNPIDGSIWYATVDVPGRIVRVEIGSNPPATCRAEVYEPPFNNPAAPGKMAYAPRGIDADRNGVIWTALSGSGHLASFDRRKCRTLNGPTAIGQQCAEGWTLYRAPGPGLGGVTDENSADFFYYNWVDQFDTLGLGANRPMANGTFSDSLLVLQPNGEFLVLRVPYPLGFYTRGLDGRIDVPRAGWKGRGVYDKYGPNAIWLAEGGKGTLSSVVKFQMRPSPLAK